MSTAIGDYSVEDRTLKLVTGTAGEPELVEIRMVLRNPMGIS